MTAAALPGVIRTRRSWRRGIGDLARWVGAKSNYLSNGVVQLFAGGVAFPAATHEYIALLTVTPTAAMTGATITETDYGSYARTEIGTGNNQTDAWNAAVAQTVTNKNIVLFPAAGSPSTNPLVGIAILDGATPGAGNVLWYATITSTPIAAGDQPKIAAAALSILES